MRKTAILVPLALLPVLAQQAPRKFELADVHVSPTAFWFAQNTGGQIRPGLISNGFYIYRDATVLGLIQAAYAVTEDMVSGGPSWLKSDLFDVVAKVPEGTDPASLKLMLQSLLADRFALVITTESRPAPRYVLAVGKGKAKLKRAAGGDPGCKQERAGPIAAGPDGRFVPPNIKASCHNMTSQGIADTLKQMVGGYTTYLDHDIVDSTNLEGAWDFELEWTPPGAVPDKGSDAITIFDAVNKQLGLTLELHDVPMPLLVVKSIERKPTPNALEVATALMVPPPSFEVAIIKPIDPTTQRVFTGANSASQFKAAGNLRNLIAAAFQMQPNAATDKIIGLPKFADSQLWDITAKYPSTGEGAPIVTGGRTIPPTQSVLLKMIQDLLAQHFSLKTHTENREITVYALTVDGKHKLTKADPSERSDCRPDPNAPKPFPGIRTMANCKNITMPEFARNLEQATGFFDHPIVDETGLEGGWNFMLGWSSPNQPRPPAANQAPGNPQSTAPDAPEGLSSYEAVQKELGLKLVKTKRSVPVIVVDHIDEKPVE